MQYYSLYLWNIYKNRDYLFKSTMIFLFQVTILTYLTSTSGLGSLKKKAWIEILYDFRYMLVILSVVKTSVLKICSCALKSLKSTQKE